MKMNKKIFEEIIKEDIFDTTSGYDPDKDDERNEDADSRDAKKELISSIGRDPDNSFPFKWIQMQKKMNKILNYSHIYLISSNDKIKYFARVDFVLPLKVSVYEEDLKIVLINAFMEVEDRLGEDSSYLIYARNDSDIVLKYTDKNQISLYIFANLNYSIHNFADFFRDIRELEEGYDLAIKIATSGIQITKRDKVPSDEYIHEVMKLVLERLLKGI